MMYHRLQKVPTTLPVGCLLPWFQKLHHLIRNHACYLIRNLACHCIEHRTHRWIRFSRTWARCGRCLVSLAFEAFCALLRVAVVCCSFFVLNSHLHDGCTITVQCRLEHSNTFFSLVFLSVFPLFLLLYLFFSCFSLFFLWFSWFSFFLLVLLVLLFSSALLLFFSFSLLSSVFFFSRVLKICFFWPQPLQDFFQHFLFKKSIWEALSGVLLSPLSFSSSFSLFWPQICHDFRTKLLCKKIFSWSRLKRHLFGPFFFSF